MKLGAAQLRRLRRGLPAANGSVPECKREENVGITQRIVIKKISGARTKVADVEHPFLERNGQAYFALLVALAPKWRKELVRPRIADRNQRRHLIIPPIESAQYPVQMRNLDGGADPRVRSI